MLTCHCVFVLCTLCAPLHTRVLRCTTVGPAQSLERVLFIWAMRHPASGYVQGINDIVTPFYTVMFQERGVLLDVTGEDVPGTHTTHNPLLGAVAIQLSALVVVRGLMAWLWLVWCRVVRCDGDRQAAVGGGCVDGHRGRSVRAAPQLVVFSTRLCVDLRVASLPQVLVSC